MELEGVATIQVQHQGDEAVRQGLDVATGGRELVRPLPVSARVLQVQAARRAGGTGGPDRWPRDPPHDVAHVDQHREQGDDEHDEQGAKQGGMVPLGLTEPVEQPADFLEQPLRQGATPGPAILGPGEDLGHGPAHRVRTHALRNQDVCAAQMIPSCWPST